MSTPRSNPTAPVTVAVIGAGNRGRSVYGRWIREHPHMARVAAIAEPNVDRRRSMAKEHGLPDTKTFSTWEELIEAGPDAEAVLVTTQDRDHLEPAVAALRSGYHVLLEKPIAVTPVDVARVVAEAEASGRQLWVAHVLRYTPIFERLKRLVDEGAVGRIVSIQHAEHVAYWHFAHSYVRGPWAVERTSSPIVLAKTCHDLDVLHWIVGSRAEAVHSFGERRVFHSDFAPTGAPDFCIEGCPIQDSCLYYAPRVYEQGYDIINIGRLSGSPVTRWLSSRVLKRGPVVRFLGLLSPPIRRYLNFRQWPTTAISDDMSDAGIRKALHEGRYGRCVYKSDNDVPDHQTVNIRFENGVLATMTMEGTSYLDGRWFRIDGTEGSVTGRFTYAGQELLVARHGSGRPNRVYSYGLDPGGHSVADAGLMAAFVGALQSGKVSESNRTSARESLESHLIGFAAERSRHEERQVSVEELRREIARSLD